MASLEHVRGKMRIIVRRLRECGLPSATLAALSGVDRSTMSLFFRAPQEVSEANCAKIFAIGEEFILLLDAWETVKNGLPIQQDFADVEATREWVAWMRTLPSPLVQRTAIIEAALSDPFVAALNQSLAE